MENRKIRSSSHHQMHAMRYCIAHGIYLLMYGPLKNIAFPFIHYLRFVILKLFCPRCATAHISDGVMIWFPWRVAIGKRTTLNQGVIIDGYGGVVIGNDVHIAAYTVINTADHVFTDPAKPISVQGYRCAGVTIEDDVWIGSHVCINKGVVIGRGSVIGAGAVVTKDIPPYTVAAGVPCKMIATRSNGH